jgi:hypothetical protein
MRRMDEPQPEHAHEEPQPAPLPAKIEHEEVVFAEVRPLPARPAVPRAVQTAAVAATGFVAGAATIALVRRGAQRRPAARHPVRTRTAPGGAPIVATRRYLVDVHLLGRE